MMDTTGTGELAKVAQQNTISSVSGDLNNVISKIEESLGLNYPTETAKTPSQDKLTDFINFLSEEVKRLRKIEAKLSLLG